MLTACLLAHNGLAHRLLGSKSPIKGASRRGQPQVLSDDIVIGYAATSGAGRAADALRHTRAIVHNVHVVHATDRWARSKFR